MIRGHDYGTLEYRPQSEGIKSICQLLENAWSRYPDQRLGQFLLNFVFGSLGRDSHIYHKEDDEVETLLKEFKEKLDAFEKLPEAEKREQRKLLQAKSKFIKKAGEK